MPPTLGNYPDTSIPLSTDATVTPDAAPTNTTRITVSTSTNFEGTLEGDPATGVVRVTDAHPAGTYTVTVTAFNSGGATATKTFTLTVTTPATCTPVSFAAATNLAVGDFPQSVAVGDFNGDGKQDLAVANFRAYYAVSVSILLGDGSGNFSAVTNFDSGNGPTSVAVGDFNGDGKQDLAVANQDTNDVSILLGNGDGSFQPAVRFSAGTNPTSVAVGDFNGDGKQDLAVTNSSSNDVSILLGNGDGSLQPAVNLAVGGAPQSVAVGDFNGDGKQDLAVADAGAYPDWNGDVAILLGNGDGTFSAPTNLPLGSFPYSVAVGDFNGDGKQDLAVTNNLSDNVSILLGNGDGTFSAATNFGTGTGTLAVAVGDFNGDGKQDLAVTSSGAYPYNNTGNVSILLGDGAGNFSAPTNFGTGNRPYSVAVGDFNGDGKQDVVTANQYSNNVSILLRNCQATPTPSPTPSPVPTATATATPTATFTPTATATATATPTATATATSTPTPTATATATPTATATATATFTPTPTPTPHGNGHRSPTPSPTPTSTPTASATPTSTPTPTATATPTPTPAPTPAAPTALNATNVTATSFTANWGSVTGATGYRLDVSTNKSFSSYVFGYQDLDVGNTISYNVTGLSANTNYYYRLRAYNGNGTSPNSNVINVKTARR